MQGQTGSAVSNFINSSGSAEHVGQLIAAITVAIKGKLCMTAPCPRCDRAKALFEKVMTDGSIRHECRSCGYLQFWRPRATLDAETRRKWREEGERFFTAGVYTH